MVAFRSPAVGYAPAASRGFANPRPKVVCLGDSQVANNRDISTSDRSWNVSFGWMPWFQYRTNHALDWVANLGFTGQLIEVIIAALPTAFSYNPSWIFCEGGGNNVGAGETAAQIKPKILTLIKAITNRGITCVWILLPPSNAGTTAQTNANHEINGWIKDQAGIIDGLIVVDLAQHLVDANGNISASYSNDGTHLNAAGGYKAGQVLYQTLAPFMPLHNRLPIGTPTYELANITLNPQMAGTAGTKNGAGVSGNVATSWDLSDLGSGFTAVASVVAAAATDLDQTPWQQVAVSAAGTAGGRLSVLDTAATKWAPNDGFLYEAIGQCEVDPTIAGSFIQPFLRQENGGGSYILRLYDMFMSNTPTWPGESTILPLRRWVYRTFPTGIATGVAQCRQGVDINVVGTFRLRHSVLRRYRNGQ